MIAIPSTMKNPEDARQQTHRYGATWGEAREGAVFQYYEGNLDDVELEYEYETLPEKDQVVKNAKGWARNNYPDLSQEDMEQEIDIKAWMLEEADEMDYETNNWVRPAYVMTALKNAVHDYARKEIGFRKSSVVKEEIYVPVAYSGPGEEVKLTFKTAKAAIMLFVTEPTSLSHTLTEQVREMISLMTEAELQAVVAFLSDNSKSVITRADRAIKRVMKVAGYDLKPKVAAKNKNYGVKEEQETVAFDLIVRPLFSNETEKVEHTNTPGPAESVSEIAREGSNGPSTMTDSSLPDWLLPGHEQDDVDFAW